MTVTLRAGVAAVLTAGAILGTAVADVTLTAVSARAAVTARAAMTRAGGVKPKAPGKGGTKPKATGQGAPTPQAARSQCVGFSRAVSPAVPWVQQELEPSSVWRMTQGTGQIVAVLDSGVSAKAPALAGAVLPGLDVGTSQPADTDCGGHGTFVAGTIAARSQPGSGFAGIAPQARILPVNVLNPNQLDSGNLVPSADVAAGIDYAVSHGATVIDVSPSVNPKPSPALQAAVANALASNVVVIAAVASAELNQANEVSYPAAYPGVLAVAAVDAAGTAQTAVTPGVRVDLAAPGSAITSIGPVGPGQVTASGAALATGYVAGTAALVRSYYPQLSAAQVAQRLELTASPPGTSVPSPQVGYGIVSPYNAVTTVLPQESGGRAPGVPPSPTLRLPAVQPSDSWPLTAAVIICGVVVLAMIIALVSARIVRSGRRRGWRPPPPPDYTRPADS
jgi:membrane-anchored mycosin MYCP